MGDGELEALKQKKLLELQRRWLFKEKKEQIDTEAQWKIVSSFALNHPVVSSYFGWLDDRVVESKDEALPVLTKLPQDPNGAAHKTVRLGKKRKRANQPL